MTVVYAYSSRRRFENPLGNVEVRVDVLDVVILLERVQEP